MIPFFSIIIPVYNVAPYLRECLDSVLNQTFADWEAICVDDGSSDGSGEILDEYATKDLRFKVIHQKNAGVSAARNVALDVAQGEWVWFVDSDDVLNLESLNILQDGIKSYPVTDAVLIDIVQGQETPVNWFEQTDSSNFIFSTKRNSTIIGRFRFGVCSVIVKRSIEGNLRFPCYSIGEDVLFLLTYFWKSNKWLLTNTPLYFYRTRANSAVNTKPTLNKVRDLLQVEVSMLEMMIDNRELWTLDDMKDFLLWNRDFDWYTFKGMYTQLTNNEMRILLPLWIQVQKMQFLLLPEKIIPRRLYVFILSYLPSGWLCRQFIKPFSLSRCINHLFSFIHRRGFFRGSRYLFSKYISRKK